MAEEDYESMPPTHSVWVHMVAGAAAGIMEHCTMYPIDAVKTRMQSVSSPERDLRSPIRGLIQIIEREGFSRVLRGIQAVAFGAVPAHALYFTVYEKLKLALINGPFHDSMHPVAHGIAGVAATVAHDAVMNPAEVVKQRMQMHCCPYRSTLDCARCVMQSEGVRAFYRSYPVQLLMNIPFHSTHFMMYEFAQGYLNPDKIYYPMSHLISGGIAGGFAAAITTPLDVCKTLLNTQEGLFSAPPNCSGPNTAPRSKKLPGLSPNIVTSTRSAYSLSSSSTKKEHVRTAHVIRGMRAAYKEILRSKGWTGLFSGMEARVMFQVPGTAIAWSVYELFKFMLKSD